VTGSAAFFSLAAPPGAAVPASPSGPFAAGWAGSSSSDGSGPCSDLRGGRPPAGVWPLEGSS